MKYKQLVQFIKSYFGRESFDTALEHVIGVQMNKERLDIYEKILIYCPELSDKSLKYINERIETNKTILKKREHSVKQYGMILDTEVVEKVDPALENFLENRRINRPRGEALNDRIQEYGRIANGAFTAAQNQYVTATRALFVGTDQPTETRPIDEIHNEVFGIDPAREPTWQRAGPAFTEVEVNATRRRDERTIAEFKHLIRTGGIRLAPGETYAVGISDGRTAFLNDRGAITEIR